MTTRDITGIFFSLREKGVSIVNNKHEDPLWNKRVTDIEDGFTLLLKESNALENFVKNNATPSIIDNDEESVFNGIISKITLLLKLLYKQIENFKNIEASGEKKSIITNMQASYFKKLASINTHIRKNQQYYVNNISKQNSYDDDIFEYPEGLEKQELIYYDNKETESNMHLEESKKILTSVTELNTLFSDVQIIVESQGELLDCIEHNIYSSCDDVAKAHTDLIETKKSTDVAQSRKCALMICIAIAIVIIILFIKYVIF